MRKNYDQLREKGLANFEALLDFWQIEYKKLTEVEYDFISPTRSDSNFGACRFNVDKGRGADFATVALTNEDFAILGHGFDKNDFNGFSNGKQYKTGFDIIGLVQRVHSANSYSDAARWLKTDLEKIAAQGTIITPAKDAAERRRKEQEKIKEKIKEIANMLWHTARDIKNTPAEVYFNKRNGLHPKEPTIRMKPALKHKETKKLYPAIIFKVQANPDSPLMAVHRIMLKQDGSGKADDIPEPKMALGSIKGGGIWFGTPGTILYIAEGPEEALSLRKLKMPFAVSTVYANNYHCLVIPEYVKTVILTPDKDPAGISALQRAIAEYTKQGKNVKVVKYHD